MSSIWDEDFVYEPDSGYLAHKDFTSLECWRKRNDVKIYFYKRIIIQLPIEEKFNLNIQIRKAAVSVTANIAEGYGRFHYREGIQFYRISRASLYELKDHLITCKELEFINSNDFDSGILLIEEAKKVLNGFINYTNRQLKK